MLWNLVIIGLIFFVGFLIDYAMEYRKLKRDNAVLKEQVCEARSNYMMYRGIAAFNDVEIEGLRNINSKLLMEISRLKSLVRTNQNTFSISKDMVDAVRCAMKHSHPDNGGNVKDFIRFQKCYEELNRR